MTRLEFMTELGSLLQDIPFEERNAALVYYEDYFEDAGLENIGRVIEELGSPQKVAATIKSDLNDSSGKDYEKVEYTENGYKDRNVQTDQFEVVNSNNNQNKEQEEKYKEPYTEQKKDYDSYTQNGGINKSSKTLLIIFVCIIGIPIIVPIICGIGGGLLGLAAGLFGIFVGVGITGGALLVAGLIVFALGFTQLAIMPINGIALWGIGLLMMGVGLLFVVLACHMWGKWLPQIIKGVAYVCRLPFRKRGASI